MISRLSRLLKKDPDHLPEFLDIPKSQILKYWDYWLIWRMVGQRVEAFVLAIKLPKALLDTLFFLDFFMGKMEAKKAKDDAKAKEKVARRR